MATMDRSQQSTWHDIRSALIIFAHSLLLTDSEAAISMRVQAAQVIALLTEEEANKMIKWRTDLALDEDPDFFKVFSRQGLRERRSQL